MIILGRKVQDISLHTLSLIKNNLGMKNMKEVFLHRTPLRSLKTMVTCDMADVRVVLVGSVT